MNKGLKFKADKNLGIGGVFTAAGLSWKVLDITEQGYICLGDNLGNMKFGGNNDWKESEIRKYLNGEFLEKLTNAIGCNTVPIERNLLSLDGQKEYGTCEDAVSVISFDEYRKYRSYIPNAGFWWWTITPESTACNDETDWMTVVSPLGFIDGNGYDGYGGVRPFCIFPSGIFESEA